MRDEEKTKEQLISELVEMRGRVAELEALEMEWRETGEALRESEESCWDLLENANDLIQSVAPDGRLLYVNRTWQEALGYSQEEIASLSLFDIIHPDSQAHCMQVFQRVLSGEEAGRVEAVFVAKDGREILVEGNANCKLVGGKPAYTRGIFRDVTERKRAQEAVRESERRYRLLAENASDIIWTMDKNLQLTYISPSIEHHSGYTPEEMMGMTLEQSYTPASVEAIMKAFEEEMSLEKTGVKGQPTSLALELEAYNKDGSTDWIETHVTVLRNQDGNITGTVGVTRGITERKWAEEQLRVAHEYSQILIDSSLDMIISVDQDRRIVEFNRAAEDTFGYSKAEVVGKHVDMLYANLSQGLRVHQGVRRTGGLTREILNKRKNGKTFPCLLASSVMRSSGGEFLGVMGVSRDITEQKVAEEKLRSHYEQERELRQRLEAEIERRAQFTRGLVHELKTPLTPMIASGQLLVEELQGQPLLPLAENIIRGASNLHERVDELLDLAKAELGLFELNLKQIDLLQLLRSVAEDMAPVAFSREQSMVLELPSSLPSVWADEGRLHQVLLNLLNNAFKWTPKGGKVTLRAREEGRSLIAEVQDTGPGIADEEQQRLFEPYYRPKSDRQRLDGLGLGLSLCKTIVNLHSGKIWVESEEGKGSTFGFSVPLRPDVG